MSAIRRSTDLDLARRYGGGVIGWVDMGQPEDVAHQRLDAWGRWSRKGISLGPAPPQCTLGKIKEERLAAGQRGGSTEFPPGVEEIEKIIIRIDPHHAFVLKIFYIDQSPVHEKAASMRLTGSGFWRKLQRARRAVYAELI